MGYLPIPYHIAISDRLCNYNATICYMYTAFNCVYTQISRTFTLFSKATRGRDSTGAAPEVLKQSTQGICPKKASWECLTIPENPWKSMTISLHLNGPKNFWNGENLFGLQWCSVVLAKDTELATVEAFHQDSIFLSHSKYQEKSDVRAAARLIWRRKSGCKFRESVSNKTSPSGNDNFLVPSSSSSKDYWITYSSLQE